MKAPFISSALCGLLTLAVPAFAQNLSELVGQLDSEQMNQRAEARSEIQRLLTASRAPAADAAAAEALEQEALQLLKSGVSHPAQVWLLRMLELTGSKASVPILAGYLSSADTELRGCAQRALIANPSEQATVALAQAMMEAKGAELRAYLEGFAYRADSSAANAVVKFLKSKDAAVVVQAANTLIVLGDESVYSELKAAHAAAPEGSRAAIELAMLATGADAAACLPLIQSGADVGVAEAAFVSLVKQDSDAAVTVLQTALAEEPSPLRRSILGSAMMEPALQTILLDGLAARAPEDQLVILAGVGDQQIAAAESAVISLLASPDKLVRQQAIFTLGVIGGSDSYEPLYALFAKKGDEDAAKALAKLDEPSLNAGLFETAKESADLKQRAGAIRLLTLRNAEGATDLFNSYIAPGNPEELRTECLKALEAIGNVETCKLMAQLIVTGDSAKRPAQQSLKRLCLNYGSPDMLWESVFLPALQAASSDSVREDLLVIADAVPGEQLMAYIEQQIANTGSPLRSAALKTLQRWPNMEASDLWIDLISMPNVSASDIKAAQAGLGRMVKSQEVEGWEKLKLDQIVLAVERAPTPEFKKAMVNLYSNPNGYIQHYLHDAFEQFANDTDLSSEVAAVLAMVPDSKERRKR